MKHTLHLPLYFTFIFLLCAITLSACQKTEDEPPVGARQASGYRLPDPEPLTDEDRLVIETQEKEYNQNTE